MVRAVACGSGGGGFFRHPVVALDFGFLAPAVLCEVFPAIIAGRRPRAGERPLLSAGAVVWRVFGPFFDRIQPLVAAAAGKFFPWSLEPRAQLGPEEVETLVWVREEKGEFALPEAEVLTEVLRLSRATVRHYTKPRVDVVFVEDEMTNEQVRAILLKKKFLRAPVIGEAPDEVVGLLDTRALSRLPPRHAFHRGPAPAVLRAGNHGSQRAARQLSQAPPASGRGR
jgi:CBS domain containing-hemolysin-like protein